MAAGTPWISTDVGNVKDLRGGLCVLSILRYPGGKTRKSIQKRILAYAPPTIEEYREPFVGGGGIFFAIDEERQLERPLIKWINDKNSDLISVYRALRDRPDKFITMCEDVKPMEDGEPEVYPTENSKGRKYNARLKSKFDELVKGEGCDQALRYFFINRTVWGGRVTYDPKMKSRMYFSNPEGWNIVKTNRLRQAARYLKKTKITSISYESMLFFEGTNVFIYCDPPYVKNTLLEPTSQLYSFGFTKDDHVQFSKVVKKSPHKICISYDDDEEGFVRDLFPKSEGFYIKDAMWSYCGTSSAKSQRTNSMKKQGKELIITNYEV